MTVENKEMGISFEVDNQQDFDKWYAIRKKQIRADAIEEFAERVSKTDINASNYPMNQVTLIKMQMLKEQNK